MQRTHLPQSGESETGYLADRLTKIVLFEADGALVGGVDDFRLSDAALSPE